MSVPNATRWVGLVCFALLGCGARSDVYCPLGECDSAGGAGEGLGGLGGGDVIPPDREDPVDPPDYIPPPPTIEMPPDEDLPVSGRNDSFCLNQQVAQGPIVIESARDLERLRGCAEIDGDLRLSAFVAPALSPLSALQHVRGNLHLGMVAQLDGLESLQQVWSLTLEAMQAPSLGPLRNLWRIGRFEGDEAGVLEIVSSNGFDDLAGLSSIRVVSRVKIEANPALFSLRGLTLPPELEELEVRSNASLTDLGDVSNLRRALRVVIDTNPVRTLAGLSTLEDVDILTLDALGIESLDELQALTRASDVSIRDNDELRDIGRLSNVLFSSLALARNVRIQSLPEFGLQVSLQQIQIRDNSSLATGPSFPNVESASRIMVARNPALTRIDGFPLLASVGTLEVRENSSLLALELGSLGQYDVARIVCNAALAESTIIPDFSALGDRLEMRGNLGSTQPCN